MPLYMDRHDLQDVTAADIAAAHESLVLWAWVGVVSDDPARAVALKRVRWPVR